eukprot:2441659-Alexandrium_andersonii.AAC.1
MRRMPVLHHPKGLSPAYRAQRIAERWDTSERMRLKDAIRDDAWVYAAELQYCSEGADNSKPRAPPPLEGKKEFGPGFE